MLLELHPLGADFPYTCMVCGEPRGVWRRSAPLYFKSLLIIVTMDIKYKIKIVEASRLRPADLGYNGFHDGRVDIGNIIHVCQPISLVCFRGRFSQDGSTRNVFSQSMRNRLFADRTIWAFL